MVYEVYKIQNKENNKIYIGITNQGYKVRFKHHLLESRQGSTFILHNAIRKYGEDKFESVVLETVDSIDKLKDREKFWISTLDTTNRDKGYNMTLGGDGTFGRLHSDETKQKIGNSKLGKILKSKYIVKVIDIISTSSLEKDNLVAASLFLGKNRNFLAYMKNKEGKDTFIIDNYKIEILPRPTVVKQRDSKQDIPAHMQMMQVKAQEYISNNKEQFSQVHKELKLKAGKTKVVQQLSLDGEFIAEHLGSREAAKAVNGNRSPIQHCLKGINKTAYGFTWKYK